MLNGEQGKPIITGNTLGEFIGSGLGAVLRTEGGPWLVSEGPVRPTWWSPTTSAILRDLIFFPKSCDMMRWIGDQMYKFV